MQYRKCLFTLLLSFFTVFSSFTVFENRIYAQELTFDHNHTFNEVIDYLNKVVKSYPDISKIHNIGKSYLGKDLLVLEITNKNHHQ